MQDTFLKKLEYCLKFSVLTAMLGCVIQQVSYADVVEHKDTPFIEQIKDAISSLDSNKVIAGQIAALISSKQLSDLKRINFENRADDLTELYKLSGNKLLWSSSPEAEKNAHELISLIDKAPDNGLNLADYEPEVLKQLHAKAAILAPDNYNEWVRYDLALSLSLIRYLHDLHYGRINPKDISFNLKLRDKKVIDIPQLIVKHVNEQTIGQLTELVEPKLKQYQKLKYELANYRNLENANIDLHLSVTDKLNPGDSLPAAPSLAQYLVATGDLSKDIDTQLKKLNRYNDKLVAGIKNFQARHGIDADGVLGQRTVAALNKPISERLDQIELAMERLRWLPELSNGAYIIVNIPAFQLWAFDNVNEINADIKNMRVVVGKAAKNETPVLMAEMRFIDFMPYWNVPYNIVKKEIIPKLLKNPRYLEGENMEMVATDGGEAKTVSFSSATLSGLNQGNVRIRQKPGNKNALGKVKFMFPNKNDVYLHDTPSHHLFSRSRRDFSHGCVRVENPDQLAQFVLKNQLSKEEIDEAFQTQKNRRVTLKKSIPVMFFYTTAFVDQNDHLSFYEDIYAYDDVLKAKLKKLEDVSDLTVFALPPELLQAGQSVTEESVPILNNADADKQP